MKSSLDRGRFKVDFYGMGVGVTGYLNETGGRIDVA